MYAAAGHVFVLSHRDLGVTKLVGADSGGQSVAVDQIGQRLVDLWLVTSGTPRSSRTLRHCLLKLSGSRHVPADDGNIIFCSPQNALDRRSASAVIANSGRGTVRRDDAALPASKRLRPSPETWATLQQQQQQWQADARGLRLHRASFEQARGPPRGRAHPVRPGAPSGCGGAHRQGRVHPRRPD
jgi:hypothetical protein